MRICVIGLRGLPDVIGGIEVHCERLFPEVHRVDGTIKVTMLIRRGYTPTSRFGFQGCDVVALWSPIFWGVDTLIHTAWALIYARFKVGPDIVHIHGIGPGFFTPLARLLGFRTVVTHHAQDYERPKWGRFGRAFLKLGERLAGYTASRIICVSDALQRSFLAKVPQAAGRCVTIRHAGSLEFAKSNAASKIWAELGLAPGKYILAVGRLEATKGFHDLIDAQKLVPGERKLVILGSAVGNQSYAGWLRRMASENVIFAGYRTGAELQDLYRGASLFVHPSYMEGFGLVISEALSADIPVLLSDIPPHREFGLNENCYFPIGDIQALAGKLATEDYSLFYTRHAVERQLKTSWAEVAAQHIDVYRVLFRRSERPSASTIGVT